MNSERMHSLILDVGQEMIRCGGEIHRVEDTMHRLARSYGFVNCNLWVVPSNIQSTFTSPEGKIQTQMRHIKGASFNFDVLDQLNSLSRWACVEIPDEETFAARLESIRKSKPQSPWLTYVAGVLCGWGFGLFFGCDLLDSIPAILASLLTTFLVRRLSAKEGNPLILNFFISFLDETLIILCVRFGLGHHMGYITVGVIMLLISGLGATNGLRDLVHLDTLSGVINITASITGAIGIALGIALPLLIFRSWDGNQITTLNASVMLQLVSATIASVGFSLWFRSKGLRVLYCAVGGLLSWAVYLVVYHFLPSSFGASLAAAFVCGLYAQIMARINKTPATIFSTVCIIPLIPGASLYYTMYGIVTKDLNLIYSKGLELFMVCFGIVLGYMIVEVMNRFLWRKPH